MTQASTPREPPDRRATAAYWTVPEIAADLGISERSVWRKFLVDVDGVRLLEYFDFGGFIRIRSADYLAFKARHYRPLTAGPT